MKMQCTSLKLWWSPRSELQDPECPAMDLWGDLQGLRRKSLQGDRRDWPSSGVWLKSHNVRIHLSLKLKYRLSAPFKWWLGHVHKVQVTVGSWGALQLLRQYDPLGVNPFRNTVVWRMVFGVDTFFCDSATIPCWWTLLFFQLGTWATGSYGIRRFCTGLQLKE